jgi:hypothetical protein
MLTGGLDFVIQRHSWSAADFTRCLQYILEERVPERGRVVASSRSRARMTVLQIRNSDIAPTSGRLRQDYTPAAC